MVTLCFNTLNTSAMYGPPPPLSDVLDAASSAGFEAVGLDLGTAAGQPGASGEGGFAAVAEMLRSRGLRCPEAVGLQVTADAETTLANATFAGQVMGGLSVRHLLTMVAAQPDDALVTLLRQCGDVIGDVGGQVAIEFMPFSPVRSIPEAVELCARVGSEHLRVLVDTWHFFRGPSTWADLEALPVEAIGYVQFDDALPPVSEDLLEETSHRRAIPGEGEFDLARFVSTVLDKGYEGLVSVEILSDTLRAEPLSEVALSIYERSAPYWGLSPR